MIHAALLGMSHWGARQCGDGGVKKDTTKNSTEAPRALMPSSACTCQAISCPCSPAAWTSLTCSTAAIPPVTRVSTNREIHSRTAYSIEQHHSGMYGCFRQTGACMPCHHML